MKPHFSEADLLETYYMQAGESMPVMMHLADCSDCAARYQRLERKLREVAACPSKPETFWGRQRHAIMLRIAAQPARVARIGAAARVAAAAVLAFVLGAAVVYHQLKPAPAPAPPPVQQTTAAAKAPSVDSMHGPIDPWASDELKQFHGVVQWESWVDTQNGDGSL